MGLAIFLVTIVIMVASLLFFPIIKFKKYSFETYWVVVLVSAIILILTKSINITNLWSSLTNNSGMNPIKLVILFITMTLLSLFLDEVGFFKWLALYLVSRIRSKQITLFVVIYILVSILTIFTSNDVIILTFTPLIIYFTNAAKIKPLPYLFGTLTAANTWSIMLIIGNPTNIYLALNQGIDFISYFKVMWFPGLVAGISGLIMVFIIFRKQLKEPMHASFEKVELKNKFLNFIGVLNILLTIFLLSISNFINIQMWIITSIMALVMTIISIIYLLITKKSLSPIYKTYKNAPWSFIPLIIGMFILLEGVKQGDSIYRLVKIFSNGNHVFSYGTSSFLASNLMNNQPMSMFYSVILENVPSSYVTEATYASIIGSNLGVLLTPLGALAGLMWMNLLKKQNIHLSFFGYIKKIIFVGIVTLILSLTALSIVI